MRTPTALTAEHQLSTYPTAEARRRNLLVVVLVTITMYYALYVKGSVAPQIIDDFDMSLLFYVSAAIVGNLVGAFAGLATGRADRIGRRGVLLGAAGGATFMTLLVTPHMPTKQLFLIADVTSTALISAAVVVAPALVRDFAPQLSRATGMAAWNLGPILGSLLVSAVASGTLSDQPAWQFQYYVCGVICLIVLVGASLTLHELSPALRAQLVVSGEDPAAVDAQAARDTGLPLPGPGAWRLLVTPTILIAVVGYALFLTFYVTRVAFWVIYFVTTFGFTPAEANGLSNWWWVTSAVTLLGVGVLSDRLGVRKPFMVAGLVVSMVSLALFATRATAVDPSYAGFVAVIVPAAFGGVMVSCMWITLFSEAVERISPSLVATGMAIQGWVVRLVVAGALLLVVVSIGAADTLVDRGAEVGRITATYPQAVADLASDDAFEVARGVTTLPPGDLAVLREDGPDVAAAAQEGPGQWQRWWWICLLGQAAIIPAILVLPGGWRRRRDR